MKLPNNLLAETELSAFAKVVNRLLTTGNSYARGSSSTLAAGAFPSPSGAEFYDHLNYHPGDDVRRINWLASARTGNLLVKRYEQNISSVWKICLDGSASMGLGSGEKWRGAVLLCQALAYLALHQGARVELMIFSSGLDGLCELGTGRGQYSRIKQRLYHLAPQSSGGGSNLSSCVLRLINSDRVFVISDLMTKDLFYPALKEAAGRCRCLSIVMMVDDGEFHRLVSSESITVRDIESGQTLMVSNVSHAAEKALESLQQQRDAFIDKCRSIKVPVRSYLPEDNWRDFLVKHFSAGVSSNV